MNHPSLVQDAAGIAVEPEAWRTSKTFDLLRVLALHAGRPVGTDTLLGLFWPGAEETRGRTSLRTATCQIRRVLGPDAVVRHAHGLSLEGFDVDTEAFRSMARLAAVAQRQGRPAAVVELARAADALYADDLDVAGSDCWLLHEAREDLRSLRVSLLLDAAEAAGRCADWRESLDFAQRAAAIETSDRATRALIRAWFAVGETAEPVKEFERLRRHLADEFGVDPAPQTRALYLQVVSACAEWPPRETTVGRAREIHQVMAAVKTRLKDPEGPRGIVWLAGQRGSGRDTVAREAARALMLPLTTSTDEPRGEATVELLPDQGSLTNGLAATLRMRAEAWNRVMIVPILEPCDAASGEASEIVQVPPLEPTDFRRLMALTLQAPPTDDLAAELYEEADGLPGLGCAVARRRLAADELTWSPQAVDTTHRRSRRNRVTQALAAVPLALLGFLGLEGGVEPALLAGWATERGGITSSVAAGS